MNKFTTGILAGSLIGAAGLTWVMSDNKTRKRMAKGTKRAMGKANNMFGNMSDMF